jgi:MFS family permease
VKKEKVLGIARPWWVMIGCCFMMACGLGVILNASGIFFTPIVETLGCGLSELSFYLTCYFIFMTISSPLVAYGFKHWNFKITLAVCWVITAAAYGACGFYTAVWQWYISGAIFGLVGNFVLMIPTQVLMENWFYKKRGTALGIAMAFSGIGGAVASPVATALIGAVGWRTSYIIIGIVIMVVVLPWILCFFDRTPQEVGLLPYGYNKDEADLKEAEEAMEDKPGVMLKTAIKSLPFVCLFLFAGIDGLFAGYNSHLPTFAITIGHTAAVGAMIVSMSQIGFVVFSFVIGPVIDKIGVAKPTFAVFAIVIITLLVFMYVRDEMLLYIAAFFFGSNMTAITVSLPRLVSKIFGQRDFTSILAYSRMGNGIIGMFGPVGCGLIYDMTGNYFLAFVAGIIIMAVSACLVAIALASAGKLKWVTGPADHPVEMK